MTNNALVTVLMPVYNAENFLVEAIESILNQTFCDFEFLIINDGSTDSSVEIINSYKDFRIRLVTNQENLGISATLNKGIELASAQLIARMDADDISYPTRLEKQFEFFKANPDFALLSTWAREVDENKNPILIENWKSEYYYYNLTFECRIYHPTTMYKRSAVIDVGKYSTLYSEDYDLWWKLSRKYRIGNLEEVLLDYRATSKSLSRVNRKNEYEEAQTQQVFRNIHHFTGQNFELDSTELECLRYNLQPISNEYNLRKIKKCLKKLDFISLCILEKENVNLDTKAVKAAGKMKKELIVLGLLPYLSKSQSVLLLIYTGYWQKLVKISVSYILEKFRGLFGLSKNKQKTQNLF